MAKYWYQMKEDNLDYMSLLENHVPLRYFRRYSDESGRVGQKGYHFGTRNHGSVQGIIVEIFVDNN